MASLLVSSFIFVLKIKLSELWFARIAPNKTNEYCFFIMPFFVLSLFVIAHGGSYPCSQREGRDANAEGQGQTIHCRKGSRLRAWYPRGTSCCSFSIRGMLIAHVLVSHWSSHHSLLFRRTNRRLVVQAVSRSMVRLSMLASSVFEARFATLTGPEGGDKEK